MNTFLSVSKTFGDTKTYMELPFYIFHAKNIFSKSNYFNERLECVAPK